MSITPRVPDIDWSRGFARHWCGGSPALTHWFNAISFTLPSGERYFRDVALQVAEGLDLSANAELEKAVREFGMQESAHAGQHQRYNAVLESQGYRNVVGASQLWWQTFARRHLSPLTNLAFVSALEHYTAILADYILGSPRTFMQEAPDMALLWGWHSAEETEHKAVCFDLYVAAGGGWLRRVAGFLLMSLFFYCWFVRQYFHLLRVDGGVKALSGKAGSRPARIALLGPIGFAVRPALRYLSPWFHPWLRDNRAQMEAWLRANASRLRVIGRPEQA